MMKREISAETALNRLAAMCSRSEHCEADVRRKLADWGMDAASADGIVRRLVSEHYVDDARYAHAYVRDKFRFNSWGRVKIAYMLRGKGIAADVIALALEEIDAADYAATLSQLLRDKWREVCRRDPDKARAALLRFAAGRGFEPADAVRAVNEIMRCDNDD
jgi:regulatory protein